MAGLRIHLVAGDTLRRYQPKRYANFQINARLARLDQWLPANGVHHVDVHDTSAAWIAFHGWKPLLRPLDAIEAAAADALRSGRETPDAEAAAQLRRRFDDFGWTLDDEVDLRAVTIRALVDFAALQNPWELEQLLGRVATLRPRTIVEIGTSSGGLLYALAQVADPGATLISVDIAPPGEPPAVSAAVAELLPALVGASQQLHLVRQPSSFYSVLEDVRALLGERPVDLLVIDGDHAYGAVRSDFEMYAPLVRAGGLIALHDVAITPANSGRGFDVGVYWAELQHDHHTETLLDPGGVPGIAAQCDVPQGQRLPVAYGFGIVTPVLV